MRLEGCITHWNERGASGWIRHARSNEPYELTLSALATDGPLPSVGDRVAFELRSTTNGCEAVRVRILPPLTAADRRAPLLDGLAYALVAAFSLLLWGWMLHGLLGPSALSAYLALSGLAWLAYARDKLAARAGRRRTPGRRLLLLGLVGGWPGALVAQRLFHHKTAQGFQRVFWVTVVLHVTAVSAAVVLA